MLFVSSERMNYVFVFFWCFYLVKGPTGQRVNGEGLWLNSLDYLPVCYTQCCMSSAISQLLGIQTTSVVMFTTESS